MQKLELTWGHVLRIWWAAFWRGLILSNLANGVFIGLWALILLPLGLRNLAESDWAIYGILLANALAFIPAVRLALKAPYKSFRVQIVAVEAAAST